MRKATGEQTTASDRRRRAGQRMLIGFHGDQVPDEVRWLCQETQPAGFILFSRNITEPAQVRELNRELTSLLPKSHPPVLSLDQEGGAVQRLPGTPWPPARWVGNMNHPPTTAKLGHAMGAELHAAGFTTTWAPVADVVRASPSPLLKDRSFGRNPQQVSQHIQSFLSGLSQAGITGCVKHFPGHGAAQSDSHETLPSIELERPEIETVDLLPFQAAISAQVGMIMTAHVCFPAWDERRPASLSRRITTHVLRQQLHYEGVIVTDDLGMKALNRWSMEERAHHAVTAGADLLLLCHNPAEQFEAYEHLVYMQEDDKSQDQQFKDACKRLMQFRERHWLHRPPQPPLSVIGSRTHRDLAMEIQARGAE